MRLLFVQPGHMVSVNSFAPCPTTYRSSKIFSTPGQGWPPVSPWSSNFCRLSYSSSACSWPRLCVFRGQRLRCLWGLMAHLQCGWSSPAKGPVPLDPLVFFNRKLTPGETNHRTLNKEFGSLLQHQHLNLWLGTLVFVCTIPYITVHGRLKLYRYIVLWASGTVWTMLQLDHFCSLRVTKISFSRPVINFSHSYIELLQERYSFFRNKTLFCCS